MAGERLFLLYQSLEADGMRNWLYARMAGARGYDPALLPDPIDVYEMTDGLRSYVDDHFDVHWDADYTIYDIQERLPHAALSRPRLTIDETLQSSENSEDFPEYYEEEDEEAEEEDEEEDDDEEEEDDEEEDHSTEEETQGNNSPAGPSEQEMPPDSQPADPDDELKLLRLSLNPNPSWRLPGELDEPEASTPQLDAPHRADLSRLRVLHDYHRVQPIALDATRRGNTCAVQWLFELALRHPCAAHWLAERVARSDRDRGRSFSDMTQADIMEYLRALPAGTTANLWPYMRARMAVHQDYRDAADQRLRPFVMEAMLRMWNRLVRWG